MTAQRTYLDHNATSPLRPEARAVMVDAMSLAGNPSSVHAEGRAAKAALETAREQVASLAGAKPEQVVFTSGGTEANNAVLRGPWDLVFYGAIEHAAVLAPIAETKVDTVRLDVSSSGCVGLEALTRQEVAADAGSRLVTLLTLLTLHAANNETGAIQSVADAVQAAREKGISSHCDAVQAAGKVPLDFRELQLDFMSLSGHKIGGPLGVGALVIGEGRTLRPYPSGGGQELRRRAGTENVVGIVGFGAAADCAERDLNEFGRLAELRDAIEAGIRRQTRDAIVIAEDVPRLANTSCIALPGVPAETLVMALDLEGIAVSAGSACSSGKVTRSHVLEAMGLDDDLSASAIRLSLGWNSSKKDVDHLLKAWTVVTDRLAKNTAKSYAAA